MDIGTRLRAHAGLWTLIGLLTAVVVFVAAAAGPVIRDLEDRMLRRLLAEAPPSARDLTVVEPVQLHDAQASELHAEVAARLPPPLAEAVGAGWGSQRTDIEPPAVSVTGEGIATSGPAGYMPLGGLHHQTDLLDEVRLIDGRPPRSRPDLIEVVASTEVAAGLGMRVGQTYHLLPGVAAEPPVPVSEAPWPAVAFQVVGVFAPLDPADPIWEREPWLLRPVDWVWVVSDDTVILARAGFVTDQTGVGSLADRGLTDLFGTENVARFWLDPARVDAAWAAGAAEALAQLRTDPSLRPSMRLETGLEDLLWEFTRRATGLRAVAAVVTAGLVGTGIGLIVLAARLTVTRRRAELQLLRARGASLIRLLARTLVESILVIGLAAALGWLLHVALPGEPVWTVPVGVAAVALLAVPIAAARAGRPVPVRRELRRYRSAPARLTAELVVLLLAGLGLLLLHQRGLTRAGVDPYLSAVPVLVSAAAGLLALRLIPWPLRLLGTAAARRPGAVGFLGLARAGRADPATGLPLLVLVMAVAVAGFTWSLDLRSAAVLGTAGTAGAAAGALLAFGFALVAQADTRRQTVFLLRAMGLSTRQSRTLLLVELLPATGLAILAGTATGAALPVLLGSVL